MNIATMEVPDVGPVTVIKSDRAKYIRITIRPDETIRLTVPKRVSVEKGRRFLRSKVPWIKKSLRRLERLKSTEQNSPLGSGLPSEIDELETQDVLIGRLEEMARIHHLKYGKVTIRNQKTKWGSCSSKNNISLNVNLLRLPEPLRDYVILHELVHTRFKNHGKEFWAELDRAVGGGAKELARKLKKHRLGPSTTGGMERLI
ncbi:MAG: M48 family metallopeptidase [Phycisphaerales bacterium]|nr:MAG: M48 family metallopeptidase [Phycisphaerales bacterium]